MRPFYQDDLAALAEEQVNQQHMELVLRSGRRQLHRLFEYGIEHDLMLMSPAQKTVQDTVERMTKAYRLGLKRAKALILEVCADETVAVRDRAAVWQAKLSQELYGEDTAKGTERRQQIIDEIETPINQAAPDPRMTLASEDRVKRDDVLGGPVGPFDRWGQ